MSEQLTAHFNTDEFLCPCQECAMPGMKRVPISKTLVKMLEEIRVYFDKPMKINSGVRCLNHNAMIGGRPKSSHLQGLAADVAISGSNDRDRLVELSYKAGFLRRGVYSSFVHLDVDIDKAQKVLWVKS